jgi:hypothetical protein
MSLPLPNDENRSKANWIGRYLEVERKFDDKLKVVLTDALSGIDDAFGKLGDKFSDQVKRAQLSQSRRALRSRINGIFGDTGNLIRDYRSDAALAAVDAGLYEQRSILGRIFPNPVARQAYADSLRLSGMRNIESTITHVLETEKPLSARVYKTAALANGQVSQAINRSLARGDSAQKLAKSVRALIDPDVPGGVSYAAKRLGRTEINNAFHAQSIHDAQLAPWVQEMRWHLSKVHEPQGCVCETYAVYGLFPIEHVPEKPHPNCRCYVTPELPAYDNFENALLSGQFDDFLNKQLGFETYSAREMSSGDLTRAERIRLSREKYEAEMAAQKSGLNKLKAQSAAEAKRKLVEDTANDVLIPESIREAKTPQQVVNFIRNKYDGLEVHGFLNDMPLESVQETFETFEDLYEEYPETMLRRIRIGEDTDGGKAITKGITSKAKDGYEIVLNVDDFYTPYAEAKRLREEEEESGEKVKTSGKPWESTFTHEFAHNIDFSTGRHVSQSVDTRIYRRTSGNRDAKFSDYWYDTWEINHDGDWNDYEDWVESMVPSKYARHNGDEFTAEAFTGYSFGTVKDKVTGEVYKNLTKMYRNRERKDIINFIKLRKIP